MIVSNSYKVIINDEVGYTTTHHILTTTVNTRKKKGNNRLEVSPIEISGE